MSVKPKIILYVNIKSATSPRYSRLCKFNLSSLAEYSTSLEPGSLFVTLFPAEYLTCELCEHHKKSTRFQGDDVAHAQKSSFEVA